MAATTAENVLEFWFSPHAQKHWFAQSDAFDEHVRGELGELSQQAMKGELKEWAQNIRGGLALVVLLDQVPRNIHRGTSLSFAGDEAALDLAKLAISRGWDAELTKEQRLFLYLPFEHGENRTDQDTSVELMKQLNDEMLLDYAIRHRDIIVRFGRFPHRNKILERASTPEELDFLKQPGSSF